MLFEVLQFSLLVNKNVSWNDCCTSVGIVSCEESTAPKSEYQDTEEHSIDIFCTYNPVFIVKDLFSYRDEKPCDSR